MDVRARRLGFDSRQEREMFLFPQCPDRVWGPLNLLSNRFLGYSGRSVKLTFHLNLVPRSRMMELYPHYSLPLHGLVLNKSSTEIILHLALLWLLQALCRTLWIGPSQGCYFQTTQTQKRRRITSMPSVELEIAIATSERAKIFRAFDRPACFILTLLFSISW
jgi:hypothetical protein